MSSRKKQRINPPLPVYKKIALSFIFFVLVIIAVIFYFTLHYAYIVVDPAEEAVESDLKFIIVENETAVNQSEGIFKGKVVNQTLSGSKTFMTKGTKPIASNITGQVTIYNNLNSDQPLIVNTRLLAADNTLFRLKNRVNVPAQGSVVADVYPDDPAISNADPGAKFIIPGLSTTLQDFVYAVAEDGIIGDGLEVVAVSQTDYDNAINNLNDELIKQMISSEDKNNIKILEKKVVKSEFSNKIGDEVDQFTLDLEVLVSGVIFDETSIKNYAENVLISQIPKDQELVISSSDKLVYEIDNFDETNKVVQLKSNIKGLAIITDKSSILDRDKLIKLDFDEIKAYLENYDEIESVQLQFFPSWLKKVPFFEDHILIKIDK